MFPGLAYRTLSSIRTTLQGPLSTIRGHSPAIPHTLVRNRLNRASAGVLHVRIFLPLLRIQQPAQFRGTRRESEGGVVVIVPRGYIRGAETLPVWLGAHAEPIDDVVGDGNGDNLVGVRGSVLREAFYVPDMCVDAWVLGRVLRCGFLFRKRVSGERAQGFNFNEFLIVGGRWLSNQIDCWESIG